MYKDLLKDYDKDDYVYVIEGCLDIYVSFDPPSSEPCSMCGEYEWLLCEGLVKDIRKMKDDEEYEKPQKKYIKKIR